VELLDASRAAGVQQAVDLLNSGKLSCPAGHCLAFSKSRCAHFILWRSDKREYVYKIFKKQAQNQEDFVKTSLLQDGSTGRASQRLGGVFLSPVCLRKFAASSVMRPSVPVSRCLGTERRLEGWSTSNSGRIRCRRDFAAVTLLDEQRITGIQQAVKMLNAREIICPCGYCLVFSKSQQAYFIIWRQDRREHVYRTLKIQDDELPLEDQDLAVAHTGAAEESPDASPCNVLHGCASVGSVASEGASSEGGPRLESPQDPLAHALEDSAELSLELPHLERVCSTAIMLRMTELLQNLATIPESPFTEEGLGFGDITGIAARGLGAVAEEKEELPECLWAGLEELKGLLAELQDSDTFEALDYDPLTPTAELISNEK